MAAPEKIEEAYASVKLAEIDAEIKAARERIKELQDKRKVYAPHAKGKGKADAAPVTPEE